MNNKYSENVEPIANTINDDNHNDDDKDDDFDHTTVCGARFNCIAMFLCRQTNQFWLYRCIISYHIISYHIISYHIISYHIISYHIISYHII